jgi:hypothetical protein
VAIAAGRAGWPAVYVVVEEEPVENELGTPSKQLGQADLTARPDEAVVLGHRGHRHPTPLGGQRVAGSGQRLLLKQQLGVGLFPHLRRHDRRQRIVLHRAGDEAVHDRLPSVEATIVRRAGEATQRPI